MRFVRKTFAALAVGLAVALAAAPSWAQSSGQAGRQSPYRRQIGPNSKKVLKKDGKTYIWAGPRSTSPDPKKTGLWYDFTGSPIPPAELQFGIGKDTIPSIDDPFFVSPDDERLLKSLYRRGQRPKSVDEIPVIGYADGDDARAYPIALLNRHELVNDEVGGKPVTVGW
ncbi:MAG: DUF3179 domain-containing protein [Planctomycetes bacterium]|nr:DUF3179 domain-containing protein [Planctomycetota bacterium]